LLLVLQALPVHANGPMQRLVGWLCVCVCVCVCETCARATYIGMPWIIVPMFSGRLSTRGLAARTQTPGLCPESR
jgi:hypothetical protein